MLPREEDKDSAEVPFLSRHKEYAQTAEKEQHRRRSVYAEAVRYPVRRALYRQESRQRTAGELQRTILTRLSAIMKLCADILDGKAKTIGMKGE